MPITVTEMSLLQPIVSGPQFVGFKFLSRGIIRRLLVLQVTGPFNGFSYCLYSSAAAAAGSNPGTSNGVLSTNDALYRITPVIVVPAASASFNTGWPRDGVYNIELSFACQDSKNPALPRGQPDDTNRAQMLWLWVNSPTASNFIVSVSGEIDC